MQVVTLLKHNNNYNYLSRNPNIVEYDYTRMHEPVNPYYKYNNIKYV